MNRYEGWREHAGRKTSFSPLDRERQRLFRSGGQGHGGNDFFITLCSVAFLVFLCGFPLASAVECL